ncbi:MAG: glycosyltransferase family 39 protein [Lentisphaeraceae bacterium]|nr:glycosyltransferase family 39 protein [Lentisphaeraceae bacterium]
MSVEKSWKFTDSSNKNIFIFIIIIVGFLVRIPFLHQPMAYDESFTYMIYVNDEFSQLFHYTAPNNHILHTLCVKFVTSILTAEPWVIRIPAFLAGLGCIPLTFLTCNKMFGKKYGFWAATGAAIHPYLIYYSVDARGYSMMVLFCLGSLFYTLKVLEELNSKNITLLALSSSLALYTIPSALFFLFGLYVWLLTIVLKRKERISQSLKYYFISAGLTSLFTILLYAPVFWFSGGTEMITNNRYVKAMPWEDFIEKLPGHLRQTWFYFNWQIPFAIQVLFIVLICLGFWQLWKEKSWSKIIFLPMILLCSSIIFFLKQKIPYARTWIFFIPIFLIFLDYSLTFQLSKLNKKHCGLISVILINIELAFIFQVVKTNPFYTQREFPEVDIVAKSLITQMYKGENIVMQRSYWIPMKYYIWYYKTYEGLSMRIPSEGQKLKDYYVVNIDDSEDVKKTKETQLIFTYKSIQVYKGRHVNRGFN